VRGTFDWGVLDEKSTHPNTNIGRSKWDFGPTSVIPCPNCFGAVAYVVTKCVLNVKLLRAVLYGSFSACTALFYRTKNAFGIFIGPHSSNVINIVHAIGACTFTSWCRKEVDLHARISKERTNVGEAVEIT
jgi:hypothetical protein